MPHFTKKKKIIIISKVCRDQSCLRLNASARRIDGAARSPRGIARGGTPGCRLGIPEQSNADDSADSDANAAFALTQNPRGESRTGKLESSCKTTTSSCFLFFSFCPSDNFSGNSGIRACEEARRSPSKIFNFLYSLLDTCI